ncbi:MAG: DUF4192 family protein [Actinomycetaceae bacterium]|nr:DUF4192 family protein [Actinomycetaceae bacterium]
MCEKTLDTYVISCDISTVTDNDKRRAEEAGKQWEEKTRDTLDEGLHVWSQLVDQGVEVVCAQESPELFGIAIAALEEGKVRDCLLMHACEGTLEKLGDSASPEYIEETFLKLEQAVPDMGDMKVMCDLLKRCCSYAGAKQGYPFALLAYLLWWTGKFRSAYEYVDEALERDSRNSLACLLSHVLDVGVMPPWLARKCGTFHSKALE